jgi:mRNA interferase MazF
VLERGRLYWAHLDKRRPALVLSPNVRNERASDVIVIPCTSRVRPILAPTHVRLQKGEGGVPSATILKCEQVTTLHKDDVEVSALGRTLSPARLAEVERALLRAVGVPV